MPRHWIDKNTATHLTLVHRPQNDPLIHDETAPSMVLNPTELPNSRKRNGLFQNRKSQQLNKASPIGSETLDVFDNEGEAAQYGIYYDDTDYDYMQHMRDLGSAPGAIFFEADSAAGKKGKHKASLKDAMRKLHLDNSADGLVTKDFLPSQNMQRLTYQNQQDVPDVIAGFQPDMDLRLREVLEALEDDAFVDGDDDDLFAELAKDAKEISFQEFEDLYNEDYDKTWESDDTAKPNKKYRAADDQATPQLVDTQAGMAATDTQPQEGPSNDWMTDFAKFKRDQKVENKIPAAQLRAEVESSVWTATTNDGLRRKKRKGALTNPSAYSMTSSSLVRTEQLSLLDERFEKLEEQYNADMDETASMSAVSSLSSVQGSTREDFVGMLDDFLGSVPRAKGKKALRQERHKNGLQQLDEIRKGVGPARIQLQYRWV